MPSALTMPPSKVRPQSKAIVPIRQKVCKSCEHAFRAKRKQKSIQLLIIIGACALYILTEFRASVMSHAYVWHSCMRYICTNCRGFCTLLLFISYVGMDMVDPCYMFKTYGSVKIPNNCLTCGMSNVIGLR